MDVLFQANMLNVCWFTTLRELNFFTSICVHNPLPKYDFKHQSMLLSLTLFSKDGHPLIHDLDLGELTPGDRRVLHIDDILLINNIKNDVVGVLHKTPSEYRELCNISIPLQQIQQWTSVTDDFVGYTHADSLVKSGVQYQSRPMNDNRLPSSASTLMHSSKIRVDKDSDTLLLLLTPSSSSSILEDIDFNLKLIDTKNVTNYHISLCLKGRGRELFSLKQFLKSKGRDCDIHPLEEGLIIGVSTSGSVAPFTLLLTQNGGLAIDHTLPPIYYAPWWEAASRKRSIEYFSNKFKLSTLESE